MTSSKDANTGKAVLKLNTSFIQRVYVSSTWGRVFLKSVAAGFLKKWSQSLGASGETASSIVGQTLFVMLSSIWKLTMRALFVSLGVYLTVEAVIIAARIKFK